MSMNGDVSLFQGIERAKRSSEKNKSRLYQ